MPLAVVPTREEEPVGKEFPRIGLDDLSSSVLRAAPTRAREDRGCEMAGLGTEEVDSVDGENGRENEDALRSRTKRPHAGPFAEARTLGTRCA